MNNSSFFNRFCILWFILLASCNRQTYKMVYPALNDGKYDSEFPYKDCSEQLNEISSCVYRLSCFADYTTYEFRYSSGITKDSLLRKSTLQKAFVKSTSSESVSGTATVIYYDHRKIALLSCGHVAYFPDTIITYYEHENADEKDWFVYGVAIKKRQINYVPDLPERVSMDVLAFDKKADVVILGKDIGYWDENVNVFKYPTGRAQHLEWGSFVYALGYPQGFKMITRAIVSDPNTNKDGSFLIDALFNNGFSGGIILAIRDGIPNFELVGIGRSVSADFQYYLKPEKEHGEFVYKPGILYDGKMYVGVNKNINYGITYVVPIEKIEEVYEKNKKDIQSAGFDLSSFFEH